MKKTFLALLLLLLIISTGVFFLFSCGDKRDNDSNTDITISNNGEKNDNNKTPGNNETPGNSDNSDHTHHFGDFVTIQMPTCTEKGIKVRACACGVEEKEFMPTNVHSDNGKGTCSLCNRPLIPTKGITYSLSKDGTYAIAYDYEGEDTVILLASEYEGLPVKEIKNYLFSHNDNIVSVFIPNSVTYISEGAFYDCENLELVELSDNIEKISESAFEDCPKLSFNEHSNAKYLGNASNPYLALITANNENEENFSCTVHADTKIIAEYAFYENSYIKEIFIGDSVTHINSYAFTQCTLLSNVDFGANLKEIGNYAFSNCPKLASALLPEGLKTIGSYAFYWNYELKSISIPNSINEIGSEAFGENLREHYNLYNDSLYLGNNENPYLILYTGLTGAVTITVHNDTQIICRDAFEYNNTLESVTIGNRVKKIGAYAFAMCKNLKSVFISDSVEHIDEFAFAECTSLKDVYLGKNLKNISSYAFGWCPFETLVIPDSVTLIEKYAFTRCENLVSVTIGKKVEKIEDNAFYKNVKLAEVINLSNLKIEAGDSGNGGVAYYAKIVHNGETVI